MRDSMEAILRVLRLENSENSFFVNPLYGTLGYFLCNKIILGNFVFVKKIIENLHDAVL
jgi:hypothetical protein